MIVGSVCSGVGSCALAFAPLGWRHRWFAEIDPAACDVLRHRWPDTPNLGDFTGIGPDDGPIDFLIGGTPCQDFSIAGLRDGLAGERGNLSLEFVRLADRLRPCWVVWENVPGVLSVDGGRAFGAILGALGEIGYGTAWRSIDAQFAGLAQRRERLFVVGYLGDWRPPAAVCVEPESLRGDPAPRREAGQDVAGTLGGGSQRRGWRGDLDSHSAYVPELSHTLKAEGADASEDGTGRGVPLVAGQTLAFGGNNTAGPIDVATCRSAHPGAHGRLDFESDTFVVNGRQDPIVSDTAPPADRDALTNVVAIAENQRGELRAADIAGALGQAGGKPGQGYQAAAIDDGTRWTVRRLTPLECERLQGLPDNHTLVPRGNRGPMADGPRYRLIGNGFAVPVVRWFGARIEWVESLLCSDALAGRN